MRILQEGGIDLSLTVWKTVTVAAVLAVRGEDEVVGELQKRRSKIN